MAKVGCFGDVVFSVSRSKASVITEMSWGSSAKWATHDRHMQDPELEFMGTDADEIKLKIHLSRFLGVDPMEEMVKLFDYERSGSPQSLIVGNKAYGKYKWVIVSTERTLEERDGHGNLLTADVQLNLRAYNRR